MQIRRDFIAFLDHLRHVATLPPREPQESDWEPLPEESDDSVTLDELMIQLVELETTPEEHNAKPE